MTFKHTATPNVLCWGECIAVSGPDRKITYYDESGRVLQVMDFSRDKKERAVQCCLAAPSGTAIVTGSHNRLRVLTYNNRRQKWEEGSAKDIDNLYTVRMLAARDGKKSGVEDLGV